MKKNLFQFLMLAALPIALGLASCVDREDNPTDQPVTPEEQKLADFRQKLTTNAILDLSPVAAGHKGMVMWNLKDDGTFCGLHMQKGTTTNYVTGGAHDADHVNSSLSQGTWEAFVDEPDIYGAGMLLSGFRTTVTDSEYGTTHTKTYYLMSEKTDSETGNTILLVVDHDMLHYTLCYNVSKETSVSAAPALLASAQTRSLWSWIKNTAGKVADAVKTAFNAVKGAVETVYSWVVNTTALQKFYEIYNTLSFIQNAFTDDLLSKTESKEFQSGMSDFLEQIAEELGVQVDLTCWMGEIYTNQGHNPRICDMNIPGTHDTFTSYMSDSGIISWVEARYAKTQMYDIAGLWNLGVRHFDLRTSLKSGELKGYHGIIPLGVTLKEGLEALSGLLDAHPTETAIVVMNFEDSEDEEHDRVAYETLKPYMDAGKVVMQPTASMRLSDCAGKLIILQRFDYGNTYPQYRIGTAINGGSLSSKDDSWGNMKFYDLTTGEQTGTSRILFQDLYQMQWDSETLHGFWSRKQSFATYAFEQAQKTQGTDTDYWFINHESAFVGTYVVMSYAKNANVMNPWFTNYVMEHLGDKMGIIVQDYAGFNDAWDDYICNGTALPRSIVMSNYFQSGTVSE